MNTYVLGAGASIHAGYPLASKLGNELYDWVRRSAPKNDLWCGYIEELHNLYGGLADLEKILTDLDECPPDSPASSLSDTHRGNMRGAVRDSTREFFNTIRQRLGTHHALYDRLAAERIRERDFVITFNYDMACERALKKAGLWEISDGYGFSLSPNAPPASKVKVLKLHGSTNWLGRVPPGPRPVIFRRPDFEYLGYPAAVHDSLCVGIDSAAVISAMILPTFHKLFYLETSVGRKWEPFWGHIWQQAERALQSSEKIVLIGYSMPTADEAARKLLLEAPNSNTNITICCGQGSSAICDGFTSHGFSRVVTPGEGLFEDFLGVRGCGPSYQTA